MGFNKSANMMDKERTADAVLFLFIFLQSVPRES